MLLSAIFLVCKGLFMLQCATAFTTVLPSSRWACRYKVSLPASTTTTADSVLVFKTTINAKSQPIDPAALTSYFSTKDFRLFFLSPGGSNPIQDAAWDEELKSFFYKRYQSQLDEDTDLPPYVHTVETIIQFPGLQMINNVTVACGLQDGYEQKSCYYETFLIAEEKRIRGAAPIVWLFQKLVPPRSTSRTEPSGTAYTKVCKDDSNTIVVVVSHVSIEVSFPTFLLRILPMSKEKTQSQGSASIQKAVSGAIAKMLETLPDAVAKYSNGASL
jgi:hypothetical protein